MGHRIVAKLGIARISNTELLAMVERHLAPYGALEIQEKHVSPSPKYPHSALRWDKIELILGSQIHYTEHFNLFNRSRKHHLFPNKHKQWLSLSPLFPRSSYCNTRENLSAAVCCNLEWWILNFWETWFLHGK